MQNFQHESEFEKHENKQYQNAPTAANTLIPIYQVKDSFGFVVTGIVYAIRNAHHRGFLHAGGQGGTGDRSFVQNDGAHSEHRQWVIELNPTHFALRNVRHNNSYLHSGGQGGTGDRAFVQNGIHAGFQHWNFQRSSSNRIGIRNVKHSDAFLHSGERAGTGDRAFVQNGIDRLFQLWEFEPQRFDLKMNLFDFYYKEYAQQQVRHRTDVRLISRQNFDIDAGTVGSSFQHTFTSTVNESFSWSLNHPLNVPIRIEVSTRLPTGVDTDYRTISASATVGPGQTWSSQQTKQFSVAANLVPNQPGRFEIAGFVDVAVDLGLNYAAIGEVTVLGPRMTNQGVIIENQPMPAHAIFSYLRTVMGGNWLITEMRQNSVLIQVQGSLRCTYGIRSHYTTRQIS